MTPTLTEYARFAQYFARCNARLVPLHMAGRDKFSSVQAVFRFGTDEKHYDVTYIFTEELDMACCRLMNAATAEVQEHMNCVMNEEYSQSMAEFDSVNPYDGSEAEQEAELMDRRCGADLKDVAQPSGYDWRMELHYDHNQYVRGIQ